MDERYREGIMDESGKLNRGCNKHHRSPTARFHFLFLLFRYSVSAANNRYQYPFPATARPCFEAVTACKRDPPVYLSPLWSITNLDPFLEGNGNSYLFFFFFFWYIFFFISYSSIIPHLLQIAIETHRTVLEESLDADFSRILRKKVGLAIENRYIDRWR